MKGKSRDFTISFAAARRGRKKYISQEEYEKQKKLLSTLEKTSQYLAAETDLKTILTKIATSVGEALGAKHVNFWDFTPDRKSVYIIAAYGMQQAYIAHSRKVPLHLGTAWVGRAMKTGETWATSDVQKDPRLPRLWLPVVKKQNYHGLLCMPLIKRDEIIGGMCIYYKNVHQFDYFEMSLATIVANQAATAVSNALLFGDLLTERNKTFATIQSLQDGLIMYDLENKIVFFNPKAEEMLWLKATEVIGKRVDEKLEKKNIYWKNLYNINSLVQTEYAPKEYSTQGPQKLIIRVTHIPVRDQQYRKIGAMKILRDVTKEKEIELLKSSFVSTASHQLRTPLSAIKWSLNILREEEAGSLNQKQKDLLKKTIDTNERLINLVADLLDVSRIEEGKFGYNFSLGDLGKLVKKILAELKTEIKRRGLEFKLEEPTTPLPQISFDQDKLDIAIRNVIDNAIKYSPPDKFIQIKIRPEKYSLFLIVKDNGIGIPEKDQKFIFVKFFRAGNAIKFQPEGSGLGLYVAKSITEKHNALLTFDSEENKESSFIFQFPLDPKRMPKGIVEGI